MRNNKGSALITVLITILVLTILGIAIADITWQRKHITVSYENSNSALYAAEAGIEELKLVINSRVGECRTFVSEQIEAYVNSSSYDPDIDLNAEARRLTREFVFLSYLYSIDAGTGQPRVFHREFSENSSGYTVQFSVTDYNSFDDVSDVITIRSTGTCSLNGRTAIRTVTAKVRLVYGDEIQIELPEGKTSILVQYPAIIQEYVSDPFSLRANCKDFTVVGPFYLPRGVHNLGNLGSADFNFSSSFIVDDQIILAGDHRQITVNNNFKVNGNLEFGTDSNQMLLSVLNGELVVNGDIYLKGQNNTVLSAGNVRCNGNIIVDSDAKVEFIVKGNLYIAGRVINNAGKQGNITVEGKISEGVYGGSIEPVSTSFGDPSVFQNSSDVKNINYINKSYGSDDEPVVIFYDGDITIDMSSKSNIEIKGIIYATGYVKIIGMDSDNKEFFIKGNLITEKKLDIDGGHGSVTIQYDGIMVKKIDTVIVDYFGGSSTVPVHLPSNISVVSWNE